jgi:hypothetical protein
MQHMLIPSTEPEEVYSSDSNTSAHSTRMFAASTISNTLLMSEQKAPYRKSRNAALTLK